MIYSTQEWNKNIIGFQSESSPQIGLPVTPESNFQKRIARNIPLPFRAEKIQHYKILNKIDNQAVVINDLLIFFAANKN